MSHQHVFPVRINLAVFGLLLVLLLATVGVAFLDLGPLSLAVALAIAGVKATVILLYFMHLRFGTRLTWVFALAAFLWLGIMLTLSLADYLSRDVLSIAGK